MIRNIALKLMYVGTAYHGWQIQKNALTVQEVLQKALSKLLKQPIRCVGAGRTDAGVHAEVYIANFKAECSVPLERLPLAVNALLPPDVVVVSARQVSDDFNAIGSCIRKEYTYRVYNSRIRNAFHVNRVYFYPKHLDETLMAKAAQRLVGTHDFRAMRDVGTPTKTTVRTCHYFNVERRGDLIELKVCANGFLYNQVRVMTGTVLYVAEGKLAVEDLDGILERGVRTEAGPTVPPDGLYMTRLWYREPVGLDTDPETASEQAQRKEEA